jgi:release factor glutamine methyltransferase
LSVLTGQKKIWTILELVQWGTSYLSEKGFDESRLTIELLLGSVLSYRRVDLYTKFEQPLTDAELAEFKKLLQRRLTHEPLQYILGETEFMGMRFVVDRRALIPRPETEVTVETTLEVLQKHYSGKKEVRILEIGTGSGCIAVSCTKLFPACFVHAHEASNEALEVARANASAHGVESRIVFLLQDFLNTTPDSFSHRFQLIVSNPPYVSEREFRTLQPEIKDFEPSIAVSDGADGLTFYRKIAEIGGDILQQEGIIVVEHAFDQSDAVQNIFSEKKWRILKTRKDLGGHQRCLVVQK